MEIVPGLGRNCDFNEGFFSRIVIDLNQIYLIFFKSSNKFLISHPLWGSQSMQDLASLMRKGRTFQIPGAIPELTACPIKDDPDLQ